MRIVLASIEINTDERSNATNCWWNISLKISMMNGKGWLEPQVAVSERSFLEGEEGEEDEETDAGAERIDGRETQVTQPGQCCQKSPPLPWLV